MKISKVKRDAEKVFVAFKDRRSNRISTFGNGGSATIANHMACDWMKGAYIPGLGTYNVVSMSANGALLSAIANDLGYEETCASQIKWSKLTEFNTVVLISSSGTSKNIVKGAEQAKIQGCLLIGFSGNAGNSNGGKLREWADVSVHCDSTDYGVIEDYHSNVMHEVARMLRNRK